MADKVKVNVRNRTTHIRIFTDAVAGEVAFAPGEVKTIEMSSAEAEKLKNNPKWEITTRTAATKAEPPVKAKSTASKTAPKYKK